MANDVCLAGVPAMDGVCGDPACVCAAGTYGEVPVGWSVAPGATDAPRFALAPGERVLCPECGYNQTGVPTHAGCAMTPQESHALVAATIYGSLWRSLAGRRFAGTVAAGGARASWETSAADFAWSNAEDDDVLAFIADAAIGETWQLGGAHGDATWTRVA